MITKIKDKIKAIYEKVKEKVVKIYEKIKEFIKNTAEDFSIIEVEEGQARWSFNWWVLKSLKWLTAIILALCALLLWGCASPQETMKYYPVNVPVSCQIESPDKPVYNENIITTNLNILKYTSELESAFKACKGEY